MFDPNLVQNNFLYQYGGSRSGPQTKFIRANIKKKHNSISFPASYMREGGGRERVSKQTFHFFKFCICEK